MLKKLCFEIKLLKTSDIHLEFSLDKNEHVIPEQNTLRLNRLYRYQSFI